MPEIRTTPRPTDLPGPAPVPGVRLAEPLAALSRVSDLARGRPVDEAIRSCLLATALGREIGATGPELSDIFYTTLLRFVGCTASAQNAVVLAEGYAAFGRGDLAALSALFSQDAVWHVHRLGQLSGDHVGFGAILAFFGRSAELTQGSFRVTLVEILSNDQGPAAVVRSQGERSGVELDRRQIQHFHMPDGIVTEVWQYVADPDAADRFWA